MVFKKYFKNKKEKEEILFNVKESACSPYKWQQKTLLERLSLMPQYLTAYLLIFEIYVIYYVVVKPYGVVYFVITCVGIFADGTTHVQLVCLVFSFWAAIAALKIHVVLNNPKRLQWFYDIVGERRVKSKLFASPIAALLIGRSVPIVASLLGFDTAGDIMLQHQFDSSKDASQLAAHSARQASLSGAHQRCNAVLDLSNSTSERNNAIAARDKEIALAEKAYNDTSKEVHKRVRTTETPFRKVLRSDQATQVIGAVQDTSKTILGSFWSKK